MANHDLIRLCGISKASFHRCLEAYVTGGIEKLKEIHHYCPQSELAKHRTPIEAYFRKHPPATVAEGSG